ncbi:nuclease-related domain-containing protein [Tetzosporium hominis]
MLFYLKGGIAIELYYNDTYFQDLEIFYARIPSAHPQKSYVESQLTHVKIGGRGESKIFRALEEVAFEEPALIIRNFVTQVHEKRIIQIDYLVVTRKYLLLIEVKNIAGHVKFTLTPPQIIRTLPNKIPQAFDCPFTQLDRNVDGFQKLFKKLQIPVYSCVVWANPTTTFELSFQPSHPFLTRKKLPLFIQQLEKLPVSLPEENYSKLKCEILTSTKAFKEKSYCSRYQVDEKDLLPGLYCPECHTVLKKSVRTWICPTCKIQANHLVATNIFSQFTIRKSHLSVAEIKKHLPDLEGRIIRSLLLESGFKVSGYTKSQRYSRE